jgi:hypothetical protein
MYRCSQKKYGNDPKEANPLLIKKTMPSSSVCRVPPGRLTTKKAIRVIRILPPRVEAR